MLAVPIILLNAPQHSVAVLIGARMAKRSSLPVLTLVAIVSTAVLAGPSRADDPASSAALEARLKALEARYEAMDRRHAEEFSALSRKYETLKAQVAAPAPIPDAASPSVRSLIPVPDAPEGGAGARDNPSPEAKAKSGSRREPLKAVFGPGFELQSEDSEFQLQFHYFGQVDYRGYDQTNQDPVTSGFSFPRQRLYFTGRITKPIEYYVTINRTFGALDLFDAFINYHYDDRLMFKVGRFKTPFTYEFYAMSGQDFLVPERSLFTSNFGSSRQIGAMAWGQLWDKRIDYAAGMFNGNRLSFQDNNGNKDVIAYLNARPFGDDDGPSLLKNLNMGGSVDFGNQSGNPLPNIFRTSIAASNANDAINIAPPFLAFNRNVVESGYRSLWGAHVAYFYKQLTLMAEWGGGYASYARGASTPYRTRVPLIPITWRSATSSRARPWSVAGRSALSGRLISGRASAGRGRGSFKADSARSTWGARSSTTAWPTQTSGPMASTPWTLASRGI